MRGWFSFEPEEEGYVIWTNNRYIYFYAELEDGSVTWHGRGDNAWIDVRTGLHCSQGSSPTCKQFRKVRCCWQLYHLSQVERRHRSVAALARAECGSSALPLAGRPWAGGLLRRPLACSRSAARQQLPSLAQPCSLASCCTHPRLLSCLPLLTSRTTGGQRRGLL